MAKLKAVPAPAPPIEEEDEPDCPRCPPVGAPAWMATFADMATLLMAFFVLILSFANFDEVSFKKMTGALRQHFGVKLIEIMPNPESTTILEMDFRPSSTPPSPKDTPEPEQSMPPLPEAPDSAQQAAQAELSRALSEALEQAGASLTAQDGKLTLELPDADGALEQALQQAAPDLPVAQAGARAGAQSGGQGAGQSAPGGAAADSAAAQAAAQAAGGTPQDEGSPGNAGAQAQRRAAIAEARLNVALREIEGQGLVDVQRKQEKVIITIGSGGAFSSGSADLTEEARQIMERIALASAGDKGQITVTGHTDSVPLTGGPFVDNWGLAAARAAAVVRELGGSGMVAQTRLTAVSRGDSLPLEDNATEAGRARNRRIEIEIDFGANGTQD
jgi:chemotaxis protein MotB